MKITCFCQLPGIGVGEGDTAWQIPVLNDSSSGHLNPQCGHLFFDYFYLKNKCAKVTQKSKLSSNQ